MYYSSTNIVVVVVSYELCTDICEQSGHRKCSDAVVLVVDSFSLLCTGIRPKTSLTGVQTPRVRLSKWHLRLSVKHTIGEARQVSTVTSL